MSATWSRSRWQAWRPVPEPTGGGCMSEQLRAQRLPALALRILPPPLLAARRGALAGRGSGHLIERHARASRHTWVILASGFFEPRFYLLSVGGGIGERW